MKKPSILYKIFLIVVAFSQLFWVPPALALNVQLFRPNIASTGTFRLSGSQTLKPYQFTLGLFTNFAYDPLVLRNVATPSLIKRVAHFVWTEDLVGEIGLHDRITVGLDLPLSMVRHTPTPAGGATSDFFRQGDLSVYGRIKILDPDNHFVGFAAIPFLEIPTGSLPHYVGDAGMNFGLRLIADKQLGRFYINTSLGYRGHSKDENITASGSVIPLNLDDELTYGIGTAINLVSDRLQFVSDFVGSSTFVDFLNQENSTPLEIMGGFRANFLNKRLTASVGGSGGIRGGYGAPTYRIFSGVTMQFPSGEPKEPRPERHEKIVRNIVLEGVVFETGKHTLMAQAQAVLKQNLEELQALPAKRRLVVEGHTDNQGDDSSNQKLSERRTQSVRNYLILNGISKDRVTAIGYGESQPIASNESTAGRTKNRRVEIKILE